MGLIGWVFEFIGDIFDDAVDSIGDGDTQPSRKQQPQQNQHGNAIGVNSGVQSGFDWNKYSQIFSAEWVESVHKETGLSHFKISMGMSRHMNAIMESWWKSGTMPSEAEWINIREIMKNRIVSGQ